MNKYSIGKDENGNHIFDYDKVNKDMQAFIKGKKKMNHDLYDVMYLRFTIAHYNMYAWVDYYNGMWSELADEIHNHLYFEHDENNRNILEKLIAFLNKNTNVVIDLG